MGLLAITIHTYKMQKLLITSLLIPIALLFQFYPTHIQDKECGYFSKDTHKFYTYPSYYLHRYAPKIKGGNMSLDTLSAIMVIQYEWQIEPKDYVENIECIDFSQSVMPNGYTYLCTCYSDIFVTDTLESTIRIEKLEAHLLGERLIGPSIGYSNEDSLHKKQYFYRDLYKEWFNSAHRNTYSYLCRPPMLDWQNKKIDDSLDVLLNQSTFIEMRDSQKYVFDSCAVNQQTTNTYYHDRSQPIVLKFYIAFNVSMKALIYRDVFLSNATLMARYVKYTSRNSGESCRSHHYNPMGKIYADVLWVDTITPLNKKQSDAMGLKNIIIDIHHARRCQFL